MVFEKKQLSKALAIALMVACAVAFMPLLNGQAFAAAKKPAKVKSLKAAQVADTMTAKATWKKGKNCKKYNVKVDGVLVAKKQKAKSYTTEALTEGAHKISVAGVNGKKVGKYKTVTVNIKAVVSAAKIDGVATVGATLTAVAYDPNGSVVTDGLTYQWYRVNHTTGIVAEIPGATAATYQIVADDKDYTIFVKVTAGGQSIETAPTKAVTNVREMGSVEIILPNGHTAPQLGDTLTFKAYDTVGEEVAVANLNIQWYVGGKKVNDANRTSVAASYKIPTENTNKAFLDKAVTVEVTAKETQSVYKGEATSLATAPIIESTVPKGVKIETSAEAPFVGETIKAVFTPEGTSDADATYQWYRGKRKSEIAGATSAEYTVTANDKGSILTVEATLSTKSTSGATIKYSDATAEVQEPLTGASVAVTAKDKTGKRAAVFTTSDTAMATVTIDPAVTGSAFTYAWYLDSVADENQLFKTAYDTANPDAKQKAAGSDGLLPLKDKSYYPYKGTKELETLVGHKLITVASTTEESSVQGSVTSEATDAVKISVEAGKVTISSDGVAPDGCAVVGKTTLLSTLTDVDEDATVAYQWYKYDSDAEAFVAIEGATGATYAVKDADIGTGVQFKVAVTATGDYYGALNDIKTYNVVKNSGQQIKFTLKISDADGNAATTALPGDVLTASASVASAESYLTYTWAFAPGTESKAKAETATGKTYTVPADAENGDTITLSVKSSVSDYVKEGSDPVATVKTPLTSVVLDSNATWQATTTEAGHDGIATPNVGETLTALVYAGKDEVDPLDGTHGLKVGKQVEYQWYADGVKIDGKTDKQLTIGNDEFGKAITVEVKGAVHGYYEGAKIVSDASGTVGAVGALKIYKNNEPYSADSKTSWKVGDKVTAKVTAYRYDNTQKKAVEISEKDITELAAISWKVDGTEVGTEASYMFVADDQGFAWTCDATGIEAAADGALSFGNGIVINAATN